MLFRKKYTIKLIIMKILILLSLDFRTLLSIFLLYWNGTQTNRTIFILNLLLKELVASSPQPKQYTLEASIIIVPTYSSVQPHQNGILNIAFHSDNH